MLRASIGEILGEGPCRKPLGARWGNAVFEARAASLQGIPRGSIVPFWDYPYRILNMNPQKGTTMEPMGIPSIPKPSRTC